jgi:hypothetical protein
MTLTFESDGTNSDSVLIKGPVVIAGVVDAFSNLPAPVTASDGTVTVTANGKAYSSGENLTMMVKGDSPRYYTFDWDSSQWILVVIGSHSHSNIELLDQLGNIDASELVNAKKMLVISTASDGDGESATSSGYKLSWVDLPDGLPAVPSDMAGKNLYLTETATGSYEWTNNFLPSQTFQVKKVTINAGDDTKKLIVSDVHYDASLGDQLLIFDGHDFISSYTATCASNVLTIVLDDASGDTFDAGENVLILVIRNGITGIMDSISKEYITKQDFLSSITNGSINLNKYLTKAEASDTYALRQHTHSQFASANHNHDGVYADFFHTHSEYMTKAQATALIADQLNLADDLKSGAVTTSVQEIESAFEDKINNLVASVNSQISAFKSGLSIDMIKDTADSTKTLSDRLGEMQAAINAISSIQADEVLMPTIPVALNSSLGGYSNGDVISSGTTLSAVILKLFSEPKTLTKPAVTCGVSVADNEIGVGSTNVVITPSFVQNDGGSLKAYHLVQTYPESTTAYPDKTLGGKWELAVNIVEGKSMTFKVTADYNANILTDSTTGSQYGIAAGSSSYEGEVDGVRKMFVGYVYLTKGAALAASDIRKAKHYDLPNADQELSVDLVDTDSDLTKDRYIVIAYPANISIGDAISSVMMVKEGIEILDLFTEDTNSYIVPGPDGNTSSGTAYFVYTYKLDQPFGQDVELRLKF